MRFFFAIVLLCATFSHAAVSRVQLVETHSDVAGDRTNVTLATAPTAGNLLLMIACPDKKAGWITGPAGWVTNSEYTLGPSVSMGVMWKISDGSENEELQAIWSNAASKSLLCVIEYSGIDASDPIDTNKLTYVNDTTVRLRNLDAVTPRFENSFAVAAVVNDSGQSYDGATSHSWSNSFTEVGIYGCGASNHGNEGLFLAEKQLASSEPTYTTFKYAGATADQMMGTIVVLKTSGSAPLAGAPITKRELSVRNSLGKNSGL